MDPDTGRRRRGRPRTIDLDVISRAALAEIGDLSVAGVASRLDVSQGAIYHYVSGREELVRLAADESLREWRPPTPDRPWRDYVWEVMTSLYDILRSHPGLDDALLVLTAPPPRLVEALTELGEHLVRAGFAADDAADTGGLLVQVAFQTERYARMVELEASVALDQMRRRADLVLDGLATRQMAGGPGAE